jgi:hypothetical protein
MQSPDELDRSLAEAAARDIAQLIDEARQAARDEVRDILQARWRDAYLREAANAAAPAREERPEPQDGTAWWLYCVVAARDVPRLPSGMETVIAGELAAVVTEVPLAEFGDEPLREHLEDLAWVERTARAHEAVLESVMATATIVPLRLCTLCLTRERVTDLLAGQRDELGAALDALRGRAEWGVKVFAEAEAREAALSETEEDDDRSEAGAYLERKRRARTAREDAQQRAHDCVQAVHERLEQVAVASAVNAPQRPEAHGRQAEMLLNAAYLVDDERRDALRDAVDALAAEHAPMGFAVELTGPWPPYNFVAPAATALS